MNNTDKDQNDASLPLKTGESRRLNSDLPDSPHDAELLKQESFTIDLPDVTDIPGQENIKPMSLGELADTTISSADEEGEGLFGEEDDETGSAGRSPANVTKEERQMLKKTEENMLTEDDINLSKATLDSRDLEGDKLNEKSFGEDVTGDDLDVPGASDDDTDESIGEEDEENNNYSLGGDDNDDARRDG